MARGRAIQPRPLQLLKGETRPSRVPQWEPEAEAGPVQAPPHLSPEAREVWEVYAGELERAGLLRPRNVELFGIWCEAVINMRRAADIMARSSPVVKGRDVLVSNPASKEFGRYAEIVRRLAVEFGMTPSAVTMIGRHLDGTPRDTSPGRILSG